MDNWIPLMDYAMKKGVSLSTLRRYIKAERIPFKIEGGRYLLLDDAVASSEKISPPSSSTLMLELKKAREEIAELKTLIAFYESGLNG